MKRHLLCGRLASLPYDSIEGFTVKGADYHYPPDLRLIPTHMNIKIKVDIERELLSGDVFITSRAQVGNIRELKLNAVNLTILDVQCEEYDLHWSYNGEHLQIIWDKSLNKDEMRTVHISYLSEKSIGGLYFMHPKKDNLTEEEWVVTDHETERARYWLPCIDHPSVRTPIDFHITAESSYTILANGALISEVSNEDGTKTAHWKLEKKCPSYLICFAVGNFVSYKDETVDSCAIEYYAPEPRTSPEHLALSFKQTPAIMKWMKKRLGVPFPYDKYFQLICSGVSGAMENITLTTWGDFAYVDTIFTTELQHLIDIINVHEMAHSYFGDTVGAGDFAHVWLKESWATYMELVYLEDHNLDDFFYELYLNSSTYRKESDSKYSRPIVNRLFNSSFDMYDMHLYPGGACRLHMLRKKIGDNNFWQGVTEYLSTFEESVSDTSDFRKIMEKYAGTNLVRFFQQWFYSPGYPKLKVKYKFHFEGDKDQRHFTLKFEQQQVDSKKEIGYFDIDLQLLWEDQDGAFYKEKICFSQKTYNIRVMSPKEPRQIIINPDNIFLAKILFNPGTTMLKASLVEKKSLSGRIWAGNELAKRGDFESLKSIEDAYYSEMHWGVRKSFTSALGMVRNVYIPPILSRLILFEMEPRALSKLLSIAGNYRSSDLRDSLLQISQRPSQQVGYLSKANAFSSLGAQLNENDNELLQAVVENNDEFEGYVKRGAIEGLGRTRSRHNLHALVDSIDFAKDSKKNRIARIKALVNLSYWLLPSEKELIINLLFDFTMDPDPAIRFASGESISKMGESRGISYLKKMKASFPEQDHPDVERLINTILNQNNVSDRIKSLTKSVEGLQADLNKLQKKFDKANQIKKET